MAIHCPQKNSGIRYTYKTVLVNVESMSMVLRVNVGSRLDQPTFLGNHATVCDARVNHS